MSETMTQTAIDDATIRELRWLLDLVELEAIDDQAPEGSVHPDDPRYWRGDSLTGRTAKAKEAVVQFFVRHLQATPLKGGAQ